MLIHFKLSSPKYFIACRSVVLGMKLLMRQTKISAGTEAKNFSQFIENDFQAQKARRRCEKHQMYNILLH
jgi:hypothetical protein